VSWFGGGCYVYCPSMPTTTTTTFLTRAFNYYYCTALYYHAAYIKSCSATTAFNSRHSFTYLTNMPSKHTLLQHSLRLPLPSPLHASHIFSFSLFFAFLSLR